MNTFAVATTYVHTVTYVTEKILLSLKEIIRGSGLDPAKMSRQWITLEQGISDWIKSHHLKQVHLEVFNPWNENLVCRWDLDVLYDYNGDGSLWADIFAIRYNIAKAGLSPSGCDYRITVSLNPGYPKAPGWGTCNLFSTDGFHRFSVGTTIGAQGLGASAAYWSRS
jgi:hypothetical protein